MHKRLCLRAPGGGSWAVSTISESRIGVMNREAVAPVFQPATAAGRLESRRYRALVHGPDDWNARTVSTSAAMFSNFAPGVKPWPRLKM